MSSGIVFAALLAGHWIADYWVQTDHQATRKGDTDNAGRRACAAHAGGVLLSQLLALLLVALSTDLGALGAVQLAAGLAVNTVTHYWADRRQTLEGLATALGKGGFYARGGAPHLDQAWHMGWLLPTALIICAPTAPWALAATGVCVAVLAFLDQISRIGCQARHRHGAPTVVLYHRS
ncbi:hypothetical protein ABZ635_22680 [Nocardiopsis sp. NPDC007018]|uniref:hypothetical protein n=1 Tax=Nocardiopsis sp. NPDC007018 TaxID=3155721 RepID=UPI0033E6B183